jgi:putative ABC transport system permease protein
VLKQVLEITLMNLKNLPSRIGSSLVIIVGIAGVVAVLVAILAMATGFSATLERAGEPDRAIILRGGSSTGELSSNIDIARAGIVNTREGIELSSNEVYLVADIPKRGTDSPSNAVIRGVEPASFTIRPEINIIEGRNFEPGRNEMIVGRAASAEFQGLEVGSSISIRNSDWSVVGVFESGGSAYESEIWTDMATAQSAFQRLGAVSSIRIKVFDPADIPVLAQAFNDDPQLNLTLISEDEFFSAQSEGLSTIINSFGYAVGIIMAFGAVFAALNTMYAAVSNRTVEIATLRAIGFGATPVVVSVMIEAIVLAVIGGMLGAAIAYIGFNGYTVSTLNQAAFSQIAFDFAVTPQLLITGMVWALGLGFIGGFFPAMRAAQLPISLALRG